MLITGALLAEYAPPAAASQAPHSYILEDEGSDSRWPESYVPPAVHTPPAACLCDPRTHFSHFTTCSIAPDPHPHLVVQHHQHNECRDNITALPFFECMMVIFPRLFTESPADTPSRAHRNTCPVRRALDASTTKTPTRAR